jgi:hypothetical protein
MMGTDSAIKRIRNTVLGAVLVVLPGTETVLYAINPLEVGSAAIQKGELPSVVADWIDLIQKQPGGLIYEHTLDGGDFWEIWFNEPGCEKRYCPDGYHLVRIDKKTAEICYSDYPVTIQMQPKPTCPPGEGWQITRARDNR